MLAASKKTDCFILNLGVDRVCMFQKNGKNNPSNCNLFRPSSSKCHYNLYLFTCF